MSVAVRPAVAGDAEDIARIHVTAWQQTYRHLVDPERLDAIDPADRVERWRGIIVTPEQDVWIAQLDGVSVAWATTAVRNIEAHPRALELNELYALASAHGKGVGQALLDAAIGDAPAFLWVAADNPRAQAFYRRNRFVPDGAAEVHQLSGMPIDAVRPIR